LVILSFDKKDHGQKKEDTGDHIRPPGDPHHRADMKGMGRKKEAGENR
jgi:hypothetical protein